MAVWRTLDPGLMARLLLAASEEWRRQRPAPAPAPPRQAEAGSRLPAPPFALLEPKG